MKTLEKLYYIYKEYRERLERLRYRKAKGYICFVCGSSLYNEHNKSLDYPFYCKNCDCNYYEFEAFKKVENINN